MSTFEGPVKELENVLIDNFLLYSSHTCYFLSHCHTDHMIGLDQLMSNISNECNSFVYCSPISRLILINKYGATCESVIKELTSVTVLTIPGNNAAPSYQVTVTPVPAGHCPGSLMFLFETVNKTVLYTGDFRILKNDIGKFKAFLSSGQRKVIDKLYFDSTFLNEIYWDFPSRSEVVGELVNLIEKWMSRSPAHNVLLETSALYGYEFVFVQLGKKFRCKVHVRDLLHDLFWNVPEVGCFLTKNCSSTRLHAFDAFDEKCEAFDNDHLLRIKLSAQWYKSGRDVVPRQPIWKKVSSQKFVMCYSTHCSCSELVEFLNYIQPGNIEPCTVAVGSSKENTKSYIQRLISSWSVEKKMNKKESRRDDVQLEKNYKFTLKFPLNDQTIIEDSIIEFLPEKKKLKLNCDDS